MNIQAVVLPISMEQGYSDQALLQMLHPRDDGTRLLRLGRHHDGGYVVTTKMLEEAEVLFGYGVGRDVSFEEDFSSLTSKNAFLFDHTVKALPNSARMNERLTFTQQGISPVREEHKAPLRDHLKQLGFGSSPALVKMDVEGAEYDVMLGMRPPDFEHIVGLVIEFHALGNFENRGRLFRILQHLCATFFVAHVHGNNCGRQFQFRGHDFPVTIEITLARGRAQHLAAHQYPIVGLDCPNDPSRPDFSLPFGRNLASPAN